MWSAGFLPHMNHVSISPTNGNGPTQEEKNSDQGGNWTHDLRVRSPLLYQLTQSYKVRPEQALVGLMLIWIIWGRKLAL